MLIKYLPSYNNYFFNVVMSIFFFLIFLKIKKIKKICQIQKLILN